MTNTEIGNAILITVGSALILSSIYWVVNFLRQRYRNYTTQKAFKKSYKQWEKDNGFRDS